MVIDGLLKRTDLWDILVYRSHLVSTQIIKHGASSALRRSLVARLGGASGGVVDFARGPAAYGGGSQRGSASG